MKTSLVFFTLLLGLPFAARAGTTPDRRQLHVQGQIIKSDSTAEEAASVVFQVKIYDETQACILWSESQTLNMSSSEGYFTLDLGSSTNRLTGVTNFADAFSNILTYAAATDCPSGYSVNGTNPVRFLQVSFNDGSGSVALTSQQLDSSPYAMDSARLAGYQATDFLLKVGLPVCTTGAYLTWDGTNMTCSTPAAGGSSGVTSVTSSNAYLTVANGTTTPALTLNVGTAANTVAAGNDSRIVNALQPTTSAGGDLTGTFSSLTVAKLSGNALSITSPAIGQYLRYGSGGFTNASLSASDLTGDLPAASMPAFSGDATSTAGTTALTLASVGTAGTYSKVTTDAKGRVIAGSSLVATDITAALGYAPVSRSGDTMTGNLSLANGAAAMFYNGTNANFVAIHAPSVMPGNWSITLPVTAGTSGQVLTTDGAGVLSWTNGAVGSVTNVTGTAPISVSNGTSTPAISIATANISTTGALSSADWNTFNSKQSTALISGDLWVGNAGGFATAVAPGGDVTMNNAGTFTLAKIVGQPLTVTSLASSQYLRYNGTNWGNSTLQSSDITTGLGYTPINPGQMPSTCAANETLTFSSPTGTWLCSMISITGTAFGSQTPATVLAAPTSTTGSPTFRNLATTDLPNAVVLNGGNTFGTTAEIGTNDSNPVNIRAGGADIMTVAPTGNVGIQTTTPATALDVNGPVTLRHGYFESVGAMGTLSCGSTNIAGYTTNLYTLTACTSGVTTLNIPAVTGWPSGGMAWNVTFFVTGQTSSIFNVSYNGATSSVFWDKNSTSTGGGNGFAGLNIDSGTTSMVSCVVVNTSSVAIYCSVGAQY